VQRNRGTRSIDPERKRLHNAVYLSRTCEELDARARSLRETMESCVLCARECRVNRTTGEFGTCRIGPDPVISSYGPHFGEERPLVGSHGSGTIFFAGCNLHCTFCQNYDISQLDQGYTVHPGQLAFVMISLQGRGCHNINLVTPTHQLSGIVAALTLAIPLGFRIPIVYNCGGYESIDVLRLLDGIVDIYMPDMKFGDNASGLRLSGVPDYWDRNREVVREMHRQVGDLVIVKTPDGQEIATRGLVVRHLVLPGGLAGTKEVARFLATEISTRTYLNIMDQYRPCFHAHEIAEIDRPITVNEYAEAVSLARAAGLWRFDGECGKC
jgi:putative pyruvate formate lyase activating enzyme